MDDEPDKPTPQRRSWRRFFQFGMGSILLLMLAVGIGMGIIEGQRRHYKATGDAVRDIQDLGGRLAVAPLGPAWWHAIIGKDHVRVTNVSLPADETTDGDLHLVSGFSDLKQLDLHNVRNIKGRGLKHLANLKNLESLSLHGTQIKDEHLEHLKGLSQLKRLSLHGTRVTGEGLKHLSQAPLEVLSLQSTPFVSDNLKFLEPFRGTLRSLNMRNCGLKGTVEIGGFIRLHDLTIQIAPGCQQLYLHDLPEWTGAIVLPHAPEKLILERLPKIRQVTLITYNHPDQQVSINELPQLRGLSWEGLTGDLQQLNAVPMLSSLKLAAKPTSRLIAHLATLQQLQELRWDFRSPESAEEVVLPIRSWPELRKLEIFGPQITDDTLAEIESAKNLTYLNVATTSLGKDTLKRLTSVPLTFLNLDRVNHIDDMALVHLSGHASLTQLNLSGTAISDQGLKNLQNNAQLRWLSLTSTRITDAGLQHLSDVPLDYLDLNETAITGEGLKHLVNAQQLATIKLAGTPLTDEGLTHLGKIPSLAELQLANTKISSAGLEQLHGMPNLKLINLTNTSVTTAAVEEFDKSLSQELTLWFRGYRRQPKPASP